MAIPEILGEWRYHILTVALAVVAAFGILHVVPGVLSVLGFFAPLLMSIILVLWTVSIVARFSPPALEAAADAGVGRDILDFVAADDEELPPLEEDLAPPPLMPVEELAPPPLMPVEEFAPPLFMPVEELAPPPFMPVEVEELAPPKPVEEMLPPPALEEIPPPEPAKELPLPPEAAKPPKSP